MAYSNLPAYLETQGLSRTCCVCFAPVIAMEDKLKRVVKCLHCGYSPKETGSISDQGYYNFPVMAFTTRKIRKDAYYELVDNVENSLFNVLIEVGWNKQEAVNSIAKDLDLKGEQLESFLRKVNGLD